jgi:hypothetical protein
MPPDPASEAFGAWARAQAGVSAVEQIKPEPTYEEKVADAVAGGADGGAHGPEPKPSFDAQVRTLRYSGGGRIE